ncbi:UPF0764 protein C16orf89 homolog isoform X2 [Rhodnius prolixus]|uniref:Uncharacterized protein n=1 Tax=Rhodnius prolixus TaxID=13249 RepID=A0A905QWV3_RHOPR
MYSRLILTIILVFNYAGARDLPNSEILPLINKTLSYYIRNHQEPNYNFVIGTVLTKGRLLRFAGINEVDEIIDKCTFIIEKLYPKNWSLSPYGRKFMKSWSEVFDQRNLNPTDINYTLAYKPVRGHPTPKESDKCFLSLLSEGFASKMCSKAMNDPTAIGYSLTHQALYFIIRHSLFSREKMKDRYELRKLCSKMLGEQKILWKEFGVDETLKDLLIEQIVFCGIYRGFTTEMNLQLIKSLQSKIGCFHYHNNPKRWIFQRWIPSTFRKPGLWRISE